MKAENVGPLWSNWVTKTPRMQRKFLVNDSMHRAKGKEIILENHLLYVHMCIRVQTSVQYDATFHGLHATWLGLSFSVKINCVKNICDQMWLNGAAAIGEFSNSWHMLGGWILMQLKENSSVGPVKQTQLIPSNKKLNEQRGEHFCKWRLENTRQCPDVLSYCNSKLYHMD